MSIADLADCTSVAGFFGHIWTYSSAWLFLFLHFFGMSAMLYIRLPSSGNASKFLWGCIRPNSILVTHDTMTLPSWLVTLNVTSCNSYVSGWTTNILQDPTILIFSVVYVLTAALVLGSSFVKSLFLYISLYTLIGIRFTFEHVSILALRNLVLLLWGFNLYSILVTKFCRLLILLFSFVYLACICRQNESSLEL